jgi:hypothetical protein
MKSIMKAHTRRRIVDFEFDGVLEALVEEKKTFVLAEEKKKKYYPLYRGYPNGSKQYYKRLMEEENQLFEQEFPEVRVGFDYLIVDMNKVKSEFRKIKSECAKEFRSMFKSFTKNPYF